MAEPVRILEEKFTFGIYVLVVPKGFTQLARTPVYLLDNVPLSSGGWGSYLPHGISVADHDLGLFEELRATDPKTWKASNKMNGFISDQLDLLFPGVKKHFNYIGDPFTRFQFSRGRKEDRLYWMIPVSVSFFDQGKRYYKSRRFMNTWRWHSIREIQNDHTLNSIVGYIVDPLLDVVSGAERRPFARPVLGVRDSIGDFMNLMTVRWIALLTVIITLLTAFDLSTKLVDQWHQFDSASAKLREQAALTATLAAHKDVRSWADAYLRRPINRTDAAQHYKEGCLLKVRETALDHGRRQKLAERMQTLSIVYGPFSCWPTPP